MRLCLTIGRAWQLLLGLSAVMTLLAVSVQAQTRDHLTEKEADLIREYQEIDKRIEIFIKAADRRILILQNPAAVQTKKEEEQLGPLPVGTKIELLVDYKRLLEEAEEKLEDAFDRNAKNPLIAKSLGKFKEAATRQLGLLRGLAEKMTNKAEQRALAEAVEEAETATKGSMTN
jgi:hypothetical protein